ncbi:GNAT family N-acetyltransferase [Cohaesibacter haloalkalitolerans]|uniref:GNAT family N-acetyltransferase n=1 Tax=Cohaesibacter haloalkalitolerans TaxID=1162980 RepID=UPI000E657A60|nr:GNAT family N-acetyltransferase [Cohaesibacter haloalkalitolerans]
MDTNRYRLETRTPPLADFLRLREITGLTVYSEEAAQAGLKGTVAAATIYHDDDVVGIGRLVGDGGCVFVICDIAVDPAHQGNGLGKAIMASLMDYVNRNLKSKAYVSIIADIPANRLYEQFGFEETAPESVGMAYRVS